MHLSETQVAQKSQPAIFTPSQFYSVKSGLVGSRHHDISLYHPEGYKAIAPSIAAGVAGVIEEGDKPGGQLPKTVITFEPLLIKKAAGPEVTLLHARRSSQNMHATHRAAILRDGVLVLAGQPNEASKTLVILAERHTRTIVPNYTNGVAAQPNTYAHYLLGHAAGLERDAQRLRKAYARIDRCAMVNSVIGVLKNWELKWLLFEIASWECCSFACLPPG